jgi:hypothetical protein
VGWRGLWADWRSPARKGESLFLVAGMILGLAATGLTAFSQKTNEIGDGSYTLQISRVTFKKDVRENAGWVEKPVEYVFL